MYNFILQILTFSSLGLIIYLLARALPRVDETAPTPRISRVIDRMISRLPLGKIDFAISNFFEKILRKSKVIVMKIDNLINTHIGKIKKTGNGQSSSANLPETLNSDKKE
ncbi:MAG: hypothetical protein AAB646_00580 [Patescibacteria group bacterium]